MKLVVLSDTHGKVVKNIPHGDVLIHCGDFSVFGKYEETKEFFDWFSKQPHKHKIVVPGNHEKEICPLLQRPKRHQILELIKSYDNVKFIIDESIVIDGVKFYGSPWCNGDYFTMKRWGFYIENDEDRLAMFRKIPIDTDVLITHCPPYGILDFFHEPLGCKALREFVSKVKPRLHVFGHIHGCYGHMKLDGMDFFNCSNMDGNYELENPPMQIIYE